MEASKVQDAGKTTNFRNEQELPEGTVDGIAVKQFDNQRGGYGALDQIGPFGRDAGSVFGRGAPTLRRQEPRLEEILEKPSPYAKRLFERVADAAGMDVSDYVFAASPYIENAGAGVAPGQTRRVPVRYRGRVVLVEQPVGEGRKLIMYNPEFMRGLELATNNELVAAMVLAHELGHHKFGHTHTSYDQQSSGTSQSHELEADEFAGYVAAKMGATPEDLEELPRAIFSVGSPTHPNSFKRLQSMVKGWVQGGGKADNLEARMKEIFEGILEDARKW